jgi:hypothetical protein
MAAPVMTRAAATGAAHELRHAGLWSVGLALVNALVFVRLIDGATR